MSNRIISVLEGFEKYLLVVLIGVVVIYGINIIGVAGLGLPPSAAYLIATLVNFTLAYFLYLKIFQKDASKNNLAKYIITLIVFFILMNVLFNVFVSYFRLNYLLAITINFGIFPLLKFFSYKHLVFGK